MMATAKQSTRETYQQAALSLLGRRRSESAECLSTFIAKNRVLLDQLLERWLELTDRNGLPAPEMIISWL
jgi:hypothetical protein